MSPASLLAELRGVQEPRVSSRPAAAGSDGPDAVELGGAYGLTADPWQADVLGGWLGVRADGRWSAPRCKLSVPRQNGKNAAVELRELYGTTVLGERFLHTAHEVKTARKHFARLLWFFDNRRRFPDLADMVRDIRRTNGQEAIVLENGGSVEIAARSKGSGRGYTVDVWVADEDQELTDDEVEALQPTISASDNPQIILCGTPPDLSKISGEVVYRWRDAGVAGDDGRLCYDEWSVDFEVLAGVDFDAPARDVEELRDPELWARVNPALAIRLREETILDELGSMSAGGFARERLGLWVPRATGGDRLIPAAAWDAGAGGRPDVEGLPLALSVDVTPSRARGSLGVAVQLPDGGVWVQCIDAGAGTEWIVPRLAELVERLTPVAVALDARSPAGSLIPALEARGVPVSPVSGTEYAQACGGLFDAVLAEQLRHPAARDAEQLGDVLADAVANAKTRPIGDAWGWDRRVPSVDISPLVAVTNARHALLAWAAAEAGKTQRTNEAVFF